MQFGIERLRDLCPIGIFADGFAQKQRLRSTPECRLVQPDVSSQGVPGRNELGDVRLSAGLTELGKQVAHAVRGLFHQRILIFVFAEPGRPQYRPDALLWVPANACRAING
jgi:hypothetical protein